MKNLFQLYRDSNRESVARRTLARYFGVRSEQIHLVSLHNNYERGQPGLHIELDLIITEEP